MCTLARGFACGDDDEITLWLMVRMVRFLRSFRRLRFNIRHVARAQRPPSNNVFSPNALSTCSSVAVAGEHWWTTKRLRTQSIIRDCRSAHEDAPVRARNTWSQTGFCLGLPPGTRRQHAYAYCVTGMHTFLAVKRLMSGARTRILHRQNCVKMCVSKCRVTQKCSPYLFRPARVLQNCCALCQPFIRLRTAHMLTSHLIQIDEHDMERARFFSCPWTTYLTIISFFFIVRTRGIIVNAAYAQFASLATNRPPPQSATASFSALFSLSVEFIRTPHAASKSSVLWIVNVCHIMGAAC